MRSDEASNSTVLWPASSRAAHTFLALARDNSRSVELPPVNTATFMMMLLLPSTQERLAYHRIAEEGNRIAKSAQSDQIVEEAHLDARATRRLGGAHEHGIES